MSFAPIRSLLSGAARRAGIARDLAVTKVLRACQNELAAIFGPEYGKFAEAVALRPDGTLIIACRSPAVAQTIRMRETKMLAAARASVSADLRVERIALTARSRSDLRQFLESEAAPNQSSNEPIEPTIASQ